MAVRLNWMKEERENNVELIGGEGGDGLRILEWVSNGGDESIKKKEWKAVKEIKKERKKERLKSTTNNERLYWW